ncbi:MAG: 3-methyladenine DNA glycosylase, partial [Gemmatimonadales bacterium]|nr:3-methyladenine DNA glycosylase [Gemmatimonadales bacterium]
IRAVEPLQGIEVMRRRRSGRSDRELTSGPGKLTRALAIGPELQRHPLTEPPVFISVGGETPSAEVVRTTRIGISKGVEAPLRFYDRRSAWVSRPERGARGRTLAR